MENLEEYFEFAKSIANYAKQVMLEYFNKDNGQEYKGDRTIVTLADKMINSYLIEQVKKKYPTHCVYGEEEKFGKSKYAWICDPIDGTAMYARQIPVATFSLSLAIEGKPVLGVILDPFNNDLYTAIEGKGAFKNDKKINVNNYKIDDMRTICNCDIWPTAEFDTTKVLEQISKKAYLVAIGSVVRASVCVASGEFSMAIFPGTKGKNFDIAAAKVIVEEAGGKVTDFFGNEQRYDQDIKGAVISNGVFHEDIIRLIKDCLK